VPQPPTQFDGVSVVAKANVYFGGNVVSHTVLLPGGGKKTLGLIRKGSFHFDTGAPELMEIVDGSCNVMIDGENEVRAYGAGTRFEVPGKSGFRIEVVDGICQYICTFLS
jgi:purine/pyrimidine-nucleoside phosphorylase